MTAAAGAPEHTLTPILFAAANARHREAIPLGFHLWSADIKAFRLGHFCRVFKNVLFVESPQRAMICGLEFPDGRTDIVPEAQAITQQQFIQFLREETRKNREYLGPDGAGLFGVEFITEAMVTAVYIALRGEALGMLLGHYTDQDGDAEYQWISLPYEENEWLYHARSVPPFEKLGKLNA